MIKYEFMRAHGKGSEGSEKRGGAKIKRGCEKKGGAPHPHFFKKGGARSTGTPPVYAPDIHPYTYKYRIFFITFSPNHNAQKSGALITFSLFAF